MYSINERVIYGTHGVCTVSDITDMDITGTSMKYYILMPVFDSRSKLFVPLSNEKLTANIRPLISEKEAEKLFDTKADETPDWIDRENERKEYFDRVLNSGDRKQLLLMILCIYQHQRELREIGKKLYVFDERFMKLAEHLLFEELAVVLDRPYPQIVTMINTKYNS